MLTVSMTGYWSQTEIRTPALESKIDWLSAQWILEVRPNLCRLGLF